MDSSNSSKSKLLPPGAVVRSFDMPVLSQASRPTYQSIKKTFKEDAASGTRDSRFLLSEMVHSHLSVEAEEERRFNDRLAIEIEKIHKDIFTKAHEAGLEKGHTEGRKAAQELEKARLAALMEGLSSVIGSITQAKLKLSEDYEARLVALAFRMASIIVDHQIKEYPEVVIHSIRSILERIGQDEDIRIRLSEDDHSIIGQLQEDMKSLSHKGRISLDLDSSLKRGDCIVESSSGEIASYIDEKCAVLRAELVRIYPKIEIETKTGT